MSSKKINGLVCVELWNMSFDFEKFHDVGIIYINTPKRKNINVHQ